MAIEIDVLENIPLKQHCSLELGGPARYFVDVSQKIALFEALRWAERKRLKIAVLGSGTNLIVADQGFDGLVIKMSIRGVELRRNEGFVELTAAAGEPWDPLVELSVQKGIAGIECLSGIPGLAGSTVVQNIGAYGQEVSQTVTRVSVFNRETKKEEELNPEACGFAYRDSCIKRHPDSRIVLSVVYRLFPGGPPTLSYPDVQRELAVANTVPSLRQVRETVQNLRRTKSMIYAKGDQNHRSVGSFFCNPVVSLREFNAITRRAIDFANVQRDEEIPKYPVGQNRVKLSAAWLIESAGFSRGFRKGNVGISTNHALALVHHGGGSTSELIELAKSIRQAVVSRFGVLLQPEPTLLGFGKNPFIESNTK